MEKEQDVNSPRNHEHYDDPTAYQAIKHVDNSGYFRFQKLLHTIFNVCNLAGFEVMDHIVLVDKKTGRIWR